MVDKLIPQNRLEELKIATGTSDIKLSVGEAPVEYDGKLNKYSYYLKINDVGMAGFQLYPMPGCCGICISTGSYVYRDYQNKGIGTILNKLRVDLARELGYTVLICTDVDDNLPQQRILRKNGWTKVFSFNNVRTRNDVSLHIIYPYGNKGPQKTIYEMIKNMIRDLKIIWGIK